MGGLRSIRARLRRSRTQENRNRGGAKNEDGSTKFITVGGREKLGYLISPYVCDYNEDGIPDVVYGTTSGIVNVALGKGIGRIRTGYPDGKSRGGFAQGFQNAQWMVCNTFSGLPGGQQRRRPISRSKSKRAFHIILKILDWMYVIGHEG